MTISPISPLPSSTASRLVRAGQDLMDWFIEERMRRDPEETRRGRLVVASSLALCLVAVLIAALSDWGIDYRNGIPLPRPAIAGVLLSIPVHLSIAVIVKRTQDAGRGALFLLFSFIILASFIATFGGGFASPATWWLSAVPLFGAFMAGPRGTLLAAGMATGVLLMLYGLEVDGPAMPTFDERSIGPTAQLRAQLTLVGFISFIALYYERTRIDRHGELLTAYVDLEEAHRALRFSQHHIEQIAENIGQAIWMYELESDRVLYANTGYSAVYGRSPEELISTPRAWSYDVMPEDRDLLPTAADGKDHTYRIITPDGDVRWIRHAVYPVDHDEIKEHRVIHIAANVTIRRIAEELRERFIESVIQAQETERKHLARELHDGTGQSLTALLVGLKALDGRLIEPSQRALVEELRNQLRMVVADIGRMARGLHPAVLDAHGLVAAVRRLVDDAHDAYGLKAELRLDGEDMANHLPKTVQLTTYRIAQEAITNVIRHARATQLDVSLSVDEFGVHLRVEDDGRGFTSQTAGHTETSGTGLGLQSMRERAALLRGEVSVESMPGQGTTVIADLPVREPTEHLMQGSPPAR